MEHINIGMICNTIVSLIALGLLIFLVVGYQKENFCNSCNNSCRCNSVGAKLLLDRKKNLQKYNTGELTENSKLHKTNMWKNTSYDNFLDSQHQKHKKE